MSDRHRRLQALLALSGGVLLLFAAGYATVSTRRASARAQLAAAVWNGNRRAAEEALQQGAGVDTPCPPYEQPLRERVHNGFVWGGKDAPPAPPALVVATRRQDGPMVGLLLSYGARAEVRDEVGSTPLVYAASGGQVPLVRSLIAHGADVNSRGRDGDTPLKAAIRSQHWPAACCLLRHGARGDRGRGGDLAQILLRDGSDTRERWEAACLLIDAGCWDGPQCYLGDAARAGRTAAIRFLVARGANPDGTRRPGGDHPLAEAAAGGSLEAVRLLLLLGADPARPVEWHHGKPAWASASSQAVKRVLMAAAAERATRGQQGAIPRDLTSPSPASPIASPRSAPRSGPPA